MTCRNSGHLRFGTVMLLGLIVQTGLPACTTVLRPRPVNLELLRGEHVTQQEVRALLGTPSATFEDNQVLAYRLAETRNGPVVVPTEGAAANWAHISHSLVLAFDDAGVLVEHRLIAIHAQEAGQ
jgi:hypothetical protein